MRLRLSQLLLPLLALMATTAAARGIDDPPASDPKDAMGFVERGRTWAGKMEYDKAIKDYDRAIDLDPRLKRAFLARAESWYFKKEYNRAIKDLDEAIRLDPKDGAAHHGRGAAWYAMKEYDKALKDLDEAIRLDPGITDAFCIRGARRGTPRGSTTRPSRTLARPSASTPAALQGVLQPGQCLASEKGLRQGPQGLRRGHPTRPRLPARVLEPGLLLAWQGGV